MAARPLARVVAWVSRRQLYGLVVLGPSAVGKTTLLNSWRGVWDGQEYHPTQAMRPVGTARLTVGDQRLLLPDLLDVNGRETSRAEWEEPARAAQAIIYLVNARHLYEDELAREATTRWWRIEDDAGQIGRWLEEGDADLCVVAVTHRDEDPRFEERDVEGYHVHIEAQLELIIAKLGGPRKAKIVTGSLDTRENADELTSRIVERLR